MPGPRYDIPTLRRQCVRFWLHAAGGYGFWIAKEKTKWADCLGVASKSDCVFDLFFGTDYHSHLGTKRGGMVVHGESGFQRAIHNIENAPFRTKFEHDVDEMQGNLGIGCISD